VLFCLIAVVHGLVAKTTRSVPKPLLLANENQNARCQRQDSHYDRRDGDVEQQRDSREYQVDRKQQHSEVLGDVHAAFLRQSPLLCTL
jgi:hypothetical protein